MPTTIPIPVNELTLDLSNFRTVAQPDELRAVEAMIAIKPDRFWALTESLIDDGYLPTENILVLRIVESGRIVKEGNRRVAALKLLHGQMPLKAFPVPDHVMRKISTLQPSWKIDNLQVPCAVYESHEADTVDRIVRLAHGKGEKAGRDQWNAVARARHNRDYSKSSEPALDLLEKYLRVGKNITSQDAALWAGDYPLTVLQDAIKRVASRFGVGNAPALAKKYPSLTHRDILERMLKDIGNKTIGFKDIRSAKEDFATSFGLPPEQAGTSEPPAPPTPSSTVITDTPPTEGAESRTTDQSADTSQRGRFAMPRIPAVAINDPKAVKSALSGLKPLGSNRQKVVTLRDEALRLNLKRNPLAFCFLVRSMFEISAKAYCDDHKADGGPTATKSDGKDRPLVDTLRDIEKYMISLPDGKKDVAVQRLLHGAMVELGKPEGILSVVSLNQLIHNPRFSLAPSDISIVFGNIFPFLDAMNR